MGKVRGYETWKCDCCRRVITAEYFSDGIPVDWRLITFTVRGKEERHVICDKCRYIHWKGMNYTIAYSKRFWRWLGSFYRKQEK